jgi:hypothetical protein
VSQSIREKELRLRGVSEPSERRPFTGSDHGNEVISEAGVGFVKESVLDDKRNLSFKRLDRLAKAYDR